MNKGDLVNFIANKTEMTKKDCEKVLQAFLDGMTQALVNGEDIVFSGHFTLSVVSKEARKGRNPRTGEEITIPASKQVRFRVGKTLKMLVNEE